MPNPEKVSILILTHNAPYYVHKTLKTMRRTTDVNYEVLVVDNLSRPLPQLLLLAWLRRGWIDKLCLLNYNSLFAAGNNIAARLADPASTHFLLLNSDVAIRDPRWLRNLLDVHETGITTYGFVAKPPIHRVDGYCFLIDRHLYAPGGLDESFQWFWAITKIQAQVLNKGLCVKGIVNHEDQLHHYGRKSGKGHRRAKGMDVAKEEVVSWFQGRAVRRVENLAAARMPAAQAPAAAAQP